MKVILQKKAHVSIRNDIIVSNLGVFLILGIKIMSVSVSKHFAFLTQMICASAI